MSSSVSVSAKSMEDRLVHVEHHLGRPAAGGGEFQGPDYIDHAVDRSPLAALVGRRDTRGHGGAVGVHVDGRLVTPGYALRTLGELRARAGQRLGDAIGSPRHRVANVGRRIEVERLLGLPFALEGNGPSG